MPEANLPDPGDGLYWLVKFDGNATTVELWEPQKPYEWGVDNSYPDEPLYFKNILGAASKELIEGAARVMLDKHNQVKAYLGVYTYNGDK